MEEKIKEKEAIEASPRIEAYFSSIQESVDICYSVAREARAKGYDPEDRVDIPLARNMAERVEGLISIGAFSPPGTGSAASWCLPLSIRGCWPRQVALIIAA